jgi:murein DD-endopeptidase MepM/ murein hydrolase activator NlpD
MKLTPPFALSTIVQGFGDNAVTAYAGMGLKGHPGQDYGVPYGTPIKCAVKSQCYSTMSKNNPNLMAYRAVFTIIDDVNCSYEVSYGHCSEMYAVPGKTYDVGEVLALVGNTGDVYVGGAEVTNAEKIAGSHAGAHLHFQVRVLQKESATIPTDNTKHYVNDGFGILTLNGFHYYVPDFNNGYNGCVDPEPFFDLSTPPATDLLPSDRLAIVGNQMMATNQTQARIVLAVARLLKAFNS